MGGKRQRRTVGDMLRVPLDERWHTYALTLSEADFAFFDARSEAELSVEDVVRRPVLFRIAVFNSVVTKGRWQKMGEAAIPPELSGLAPKFIQDALCPDRFEIQLGGERRPSTLEECAGLERGAVWEGAHVEERLRDHYAGVPNRWVESMRPNRLVSVVRDVLLKDWDPRGVGEGELRAYDGYIEGITRKLHLGVEGLAEHLFALETISMRLAGDRERCVRAAGRLFLLAPARRY